MSRVRANDYDEKKTAILDAAAALFAELGYAGAKMEDIAARCGASKSMLYHYFKKKEDVLFEMLQQHVQSIAADIERYLASADASDHDEFLRGLIKAYLEPKKTARARHVVALHDMRYLTEEQQRRQELLEREVVRLLVIGLERIVPHESAQDGRVYALLLIGMLNWTELWYRRSGRMSPPELYDRVSRLFLHGLLSTPVLTSATRAGRKTRRTASRS